MSKPEFLQSRIRKLERKQKQMETEIGKLRKDLNSKLEPLSDIRDILQMSLSKVVGDKEAVEKLKKVFKTESGN